MAGTKEGWLKAKQKMIVRYGSLEAFREHMADIGGQGGRNGNTGGFADEEVGKDGLTGRERAMIAGAKGGRISRRRKSN